MSMVIFVIIFDYFHECHKFKGGHRSNLDKTEVKLSE